MGKRWSDMWKRWERNGNAEVVKAGFVALGIIAMLVVLVIVSPGGIELFDTLKGM